MYAAVMELVDLVDSKSSALGRVGSNPTCGTTTIFVKCGRSSVARVPAFQAGCRGFESLRPLHFNKLFHTHYGYAGVAQR